MVRPGHQPQGGPQTDNLKERAGRRVMVEGRLCAATVAAPQGGKRSRRQVEQASIDLGARLAADRQGAIGEIYAALGTTVLNYLQRLVGRDDAEDVLQRVFYEVWLHNGRYDPSRSLVGWVLGIARNRAIDHLRGQRNTAVALETLNDILGEDGRELAERYARSHEVRSALIRLPEEQREVLVLAYFGGYTQSQIATYLDLPLGTVKARALRGLRRLAKLLLP
jgi:RNA polymerase sigma factor (sigma-70 family)